MIVAIHLPTKPHTLHPVAMAGFLLVNQHLSSTMQSWLIAESLLYWVSSNCNVVRTLKDQWLALALGGTALSALFWLELMA